MTLPMRRSTILFAGLSALLIGIKLLFDHYPGDFPLRDQASAFTWPLVAGVLVIGLCGLLADRAARLPDPLSDGRRERFGSFWATVAGAAYGLITIAVFLLQPSGHVLGSGEVWDHVPWPWSVPFYAFGTIFLEFLLRLGALCILFWLIQVVLLRRRFQSVVFWSVAAVVSLYEIAPFLADDVANGRWLDVATAPIQPLYWSNLLEAGLLWRYGWLTPIVFRAVFYLVWHVLFGGFAQPLVT